MSTVAFGQITFETSGTLISVFHFYLSISDVSKKCALQEGLCDFVFIIVLQFSILQK